MMSGIDIAFVPFHLCPHNAKMSVDRTMFSVNYYHLCGIFKCTVIITQLIILHILIELQVRQLIVV